MTQQRDQNVQHGAPIGDGMRDTPTSADDRVATGDRREDVHFERDHEGQLKVQHLKKPAGPLPPQTATTDGLPPGNGPPVQDVAVAPEGPSVWDARPIEDDDVTDHPGR
jgi:hypothetical protein